MDVLGRCPTNEYLKSKSQDTQKLWAQVPAIHLLDGILVGKPSDDSHIQLVVPRVLRKRLFEVTHAGLSGTLRTSTYFASTQALILLARHDHWHSSLVPPMWNLCIKSWSSNQAPRKTTKVLTGAPLGIVAVDILSGLPTTPDGMKYILLLTDYFMKWASAFLLPDAEESTCMRAMYDGFFSIFALPCQLLSDQGKNYESKLIHELC